MRNAPWIALQFRVVILSGVVLIPGVVCGAPHEKPPVNEPVPATSVDPPTVQEESGPPAEAGDIQERGVCRAVINEVLVGTVENPTEQFVELFNPCATAFNLSGFSLRYRDLNIFVVQSKTLASPLLEGMFLLQPGGYLVYGGPGYHGPSNGVLRIDLRAVGAIELQDQSGHRYDSITFVPGPLVMETTAAPAPVLSPSPGQSLSRVPNGVDTNNNGSDFKVTPPTPMGANAQSVQSPIPTPSPDPSSPLPGQPSATTCHPVINEVLLGTRENPTEEFVELFNPCPTAFNLDGGILRGQGLLSGHFFVGTAMPLSNLQGVLQPRGYQVYAGPGYHGPSNGALQLDIGSYTAIEFFAGGRYDLVTFYPGESSHLTPLIKEKNYAPWPMLIPSPGMSASRVPNGVDTDDNGSDFKLTPPTPMAANVHPALACHPVINEILVGSTGNLAEEFVELFNPCATAISLDGWRLVYRSATSTVPANGGDTALLVTLQGDVLQPGGLRVYSGPGYRGSSNGALLSGIPEGPGAAIGLRDPNYYLMDSVLLGAFPNQDSGITAGNAFMEGVLPAPPPSLSPSPGLSLSRVPNGVDTNNNGIDFKVTPPTPMAANATPLPGQPVPGTPDPGTPCPPGTTLNPATTPPSCVAAQPTPGCPAGMTVINGTCVDPSPAVACPAGQTFNPTTRTCVIATPGCPPGTTLNPATTPPSCVAAQPTPGCPAGMTVINGACVDPSPAVACPAGQTFNPTTRTCVGSQMCRAGTILCNGICTNLGTDPRNCGACGKACASGRQCMKGKCR